MKSYTQFIAEAREQLRGKQVSAEDHPLYKERSEPLTPLHSDDDVQKALESDTTSRKIMSKGHVPKRGELVGARLNLNVLKNTGVPVMTAHKATNKTGYKAGKGFYGGEARSYHHVMTLRNAEFNVNQKAREDIATGKQNKFPMASVDGEHDPDAKHNFSGVVASFNPKRHHLFVDEEGKAVKSAEEVTLHGHKAYLRGKIEYHTPSTEPSRAGDAPSAVSLKEETTWQIYFG